MTYRSSLVLYAVVLFASFIGVSAVYEDLRLKRKLSAAVVFSSFWAIAGGGFLLISILFFTPDKLLTEGMLASMGGASLGWLLGMYISPIGKSEAGAFQKYGTALAGVLSGYTLKSVVEYIRQDQVRLLQHRVSIALFAISTLLAMAAVYNSRAYDNNLLEIHSESPDPPRNGACIKIALNKAANFYAEVVGPTNPAVRWNVYPLPGEDPQHLPVLTQAGTVTAGANAVRCRLIAVSIEDPTLANFVDLEIS